MLHWLLNQNYTSIYVDAFFFNFLSITYFISQINGKFFFLSHSRFLLNVNTLNFNYFGPTVFNSNFFFFFFRRTWVKNERHQLKFFHFLKINNVKLVFMFGLFFKNSLVTPLLDGQILLAGFLEKKQKNYLYDYPLYVNKLNLLSIIYIYMYFIKISAKTFFLKPAYIHTLSLSFFY